MFFPSPRSGLKKFEAGGRRLRIDLQVEDPAFLASRFQKLSFPILYFLIQVAQREGLGAYNLQISLRQRVLFHVAKSLIPNPPSGFGRLTVFQAIFATLLSMMFPVHKNLEQRL
ncbi:unnamed protein product [Brassica rapa subsp. trilocularis]